MKTPRRSEAGRMMAWLAPALLCGLAGLGLARGSATEPETRVTLSNSRLTEAIPPSSINPDTSPAIFVPVLLTASGQNSSFFTSELTLTNRGGEEVTIHYTYTAHTGGGSGTASDRLSPGQQKIHADALVYLRRLGIPIPHSGNRLGTLRLEVVGSSDIGVSVRTTTSVPEGRAGVAYRGIAVADGFAEAVYLCGLRQNRQDRSNVAFQNMGRQGNLTLRTTVYSGEAENRSPHVLPEVTLEPGRFHQINGILDKAGFAQGYVRVERVSGTAPFYAYGVINDQANSDGSFVFPVTASSLVGTTGQTLPVIVESGVFTSELTVTNFSDVARTLAFHFRAEAVQTPDKTTAVEWTLRPGQQVIVPDIVERMRQRGIQGIGPSRQTFAGALFATVVSGDMSGIVIGARTSSSDGRGGRYGVFYHAAPFGEAFLGEAWVDGLQQNQENRSNLALVNTGEVDASPSVFQLDIYDGATGTLANTVTGLTVAARGWLQINSVLGEHAPGATQGYVRIRKVSGNNSFLAYGVINDGGAPGERSGDGAYLPATERIIDPGTDAMTDRKILEAFYHATGGPGWTDRTNWLSPLPLSEWHGVTTDGNGRVVSLYLPRNKLSGGIPSELGGLTQLIRLDLAGNELTGTLPPDLGGLTHLQWLSVKSNDLSGGIPSELGGLTQLIRLDLAGNELTGTIPPDLGGLTSLETLHLRENQLSGPIPPELGGLTHLQWLSVKSNDLSGAIPKVLQQLSELTLLDLRETQLCVPTDDALKAWLETISRFFSSGIVCDGTRRVLFSASSYEVREGGSVKVWVRLIDQIGDPARPTVIFLTDKPGGGATAADYSGVPKGVTITTSKAEASFVVEAVKDDYFDDGETVVLGFRSPLPSGIIAGSPATATVTIIDPGTEEVTDREVLEALYHATGGPKWRNNTHWLSALPLSEWSGVGTDGSGRVTSLSLSHNRMRGTIPPVLGQLNQLQVLDLEFNQLRGEIPVELAGLSKLEVLDLGINQLTGEIPVELAGLSRLQSLDLDGNDLSGAIPPDLGGLTQLQWLALSSNQLSGGIPAELAELAQLEVLDLEFNQLNGQIPPVLGGLIDLQVLNLRINQLTGEIPVELAGLSNLEVLNLRSNQLGGEIPVELAGLSNLEVLDLSINQLTGEIPVELAGLTKLQCLDLGRNDLIGTIPTVLGQLSQLQELGLEFNQLSGAIPPELASLTQLVSLALSGNQLSGAIPPELASLTQLVSLALSGNQLSGEIPPDLGGLTQLRWLGIGKNELTGAIPPELGDLIQLRGLDLGGSKLSGTIPAELAKLTHLSGLDLGFNSDLTGTFPRELQQLPLTTLNLMGTSVCVPEDTELQEWMAMIEWFTPSGLKCGLPPAAISLIDILVVYTPAARRIAGGTAEIEAVIDLMIAETNQAYMDGGVNQRLILVASKEVEYAESGSSTRDIGRLASSSDGYMDEVHAIRDRAGADLVHLIVGAANYHGVANVAGAFGLTWARGGSETFAHELGHNMGLHHDRYVTPGSQTFPYGHGYVNQQAFADGAPESARWRTIMAYADQCSQAGFGCDAIMRFSNPNQTYLGDPLGVPGDERTTAVDGPADAVRTLNLTRHSVAGFRPRTSGNQLTMSSKLSEAPSMARTGGGLAALTPRGSLFKAVAPNGRGADPQQEGGGLDRATLRRREVSVDIGRLARSADGTGTALLLNLFDDVVLLGIVERQTPTHSGGYAVSGRLVGVPSGTVTLVVNGSVVVGTVRIPGVTYRIRPAGGDSHAIIEIDPSLLVQLCGTGGGRRVWSDESGEASARLSGDKDTDYGQ